MKNSQRELEASEAPNVNLGGHGSLKSEMQTENYSDA